MSKVKAVKPMSFGHHNVELEDGTFLQITRGTPVPKVGEEYVKHVPAPVAPYPEYAHAGNVKKIARPEVKPDAVDTKASEAIAVESEPVVEQSAGQDEVGTAPESGDGTPEEGEPGIEEIGEAE